MFFHSQNTKLIKSDSRHLCYTHFLFQIHVVFLNCSSMKIEKSITVYTNILRNAIIFKIDNIY